MPNKKTLGPEIKTLGQAVRALRNDAGLTLRGLADTLGVSAPFLSDVEHDRRRPSNMPALAKALGVTDSELRKLDDRMPADLKAWVRENPEVVSFLRDLKESGRQVREVRLLFARAEHETKRR